jgi:hypothetical protein
MKRREGQQWDRALAAAQVCSAQATRGCIAPATPAGSASPVIAANASAARCRCSQARAPRPLRVTLTHSLPPPPPPPQESAQEAARTSRLLAVQEVARLLKPVGLENMAQNLVAKEEIDGPTLKCAPNANELVQEGRH